jgi:hypothetical protein
MSKAFVAALCAWTLAFAFIGFSGASWMTAPTLVVAVGLTALWFAHIGAFALRMAIATERATHAPTRNISTQTAVPASFGRRQFAAEFVRAAAFAAVATVLTLRASTALAQGKCDCSKCRTGQSCCPTANGYCGCFPMRCP